MVLLVRVILGGMFALAAIGKLSDRQGAWRAVVAFGIPSAIAAPVGWALVCAELSVLALMFTARSTPVGGAVALILLLAFSGVIGLNLIRGRRPDCHCFGRGSSGPIGWPSVARNSCFAALAAFLASGGRFEPLLGVAVVGLGLWVWPAARRRWVQRNGAPAAAFTLPDQTGQAWSLDALLDAGRPLVVVFSQAGCPACDALLPEVAGWQHNLNHRVTTVVVAAGAAEHNIVKAREHGLERVLLDEGRTMLAAYGIAATPSAVLIGASRSLAAPVAMGAAAIESLVTQTAASADEAKLTRRRLLGRSMVGMASITVAAVASACGASSKSTSSTTAAAQNALEVDGAWLCNQTFALCTTAPCELSKTDPSISVCRCVVQNGYSVGFKSCTERAQSGDKLYSEFSTVNVNPSFGVLTCPSGDPWANCLDVECHLDPTNPAVALCQCVTVKTGKSLTFGGGCEESTCASTIWSAATPDLPGSAQYTKGMKQLHQPITFPKTCPSSPSSTTATTTSTTTSR